MPIYFRRHLPHYHPPNAVYFVTFRLAGSLPRALVADLQAEREREIQRTNGLRREAQERYFARLETLLDQAQHGPRWLAEPQCAQIVMDAMFAYQPEHYRLLAFCLMSNHVHLVLDMEGIPPPPPRRDGKQYTALSQALRLIKGRSAAYCNRVLGRRGSFWQQESYDRVMRDAAELERALWYVLNNPVQAGLVDDWRNWPYVYLAPDLSLSW